MPYGDEEEDRDHDKRVQDGANHMRRTGDSPDEAAEKHDADRDEVVKRFGEDMEKLYGKRDKDKDDE